MFIAPSDPELETYYGGDGYARAYAEFQRCVRVCAEEFGRQTGETFEPLFHLARRPETHAEIGGHQRDDSLLAKGFPIPYAQGADGNRLISIFIEEAGAAWPELPLPLRSEVAGKDFRRWFILYAYGGGIAAGAHTIMHELRRDGFPPVEYFYEPPFVTRDDPQPWRRHEWVSAPDPGRLVKSFYNDAWFDPADGHGYLDVGGGRRARMLHIALPADVGPATLTPHWDQGTGWFGSKGLAPVLLGHPDPGFPGDMTDGTGPVQHEIWHEFGDSHVSPFRDVDGWVIRTTHMLTPYDGDLRMVTMRNGETLFKRVATIGLTSTDVGHGSIPFAPWGRIHLYGEGFDIVAVRPGELDVIRGQDGVFEDPDGIPAGAWHYAGKDVVYLYQGGPWSPFQAEQVRHDGAMWLRPVVVEPGGEPDPTPEPAPLGLRVEVPAFMRVGEVEQARAIMRYSNNTELEVDAAWFASGRSVTVGQDGTVTAVKQGSAEVRAEAQGFSASPVTVRVRRR
jgi:hypothetical protein